jgi:hypothetical protein
MTLLLADQHAVHHGDSLHSGGYLDGVSNGKLALVSSLMRAWLPGSR